MSETTLLLSDKDSDPREHRHWRRVVRVLAVLVAAVLGAVAVLAGVSAYYASKYDNNVSRIEADLVKIPAASRPIRSRGDSLNLLLVGSDTRAPHSNAGASADPTENGRSDVVMIIHVAGDRRSAYVISIPRDALVDIPRGHGKRKINAAYRLGGPSLLVQTVEQLTKIRIDHYLAIDFFGFAAMTDAVGGVNINVPSDSYDSVNNKRWRAGPQLMDGEEALLFVRQRDGLPGSDLDRINHQHLFLKALMAKTTDGGQLRNPIMLTRFLDAATKSLSVDSGLSAGDLRSLALRLLDAGGESVHFLTVPVKGIGLLNEELVRYLDPVRDEALYQAVRTDTMASYRPASTAHD